MYDIEHLKWDGTVRRNKKRNIQIKTLEEFLTSDSNILISTDVFSRGIDYSNVKRIINWSPPHNPALYLNRIGRMGRVNHSFIGEAVTFRYDS